MRNFGRRLFSEAPLILSRKMDSFPWGMMTIGNVRTLAAEHWLRNLRNKNGDSMANSTKAKIRSLMSVLFNHGYSVRVVGAG